MVARRQLIAAGRRLGGALATLWLLASLSFVAVRLAPGDPARVTDPEVPASYRQSLAHLYGLDRPLPKQYTAWLSGWLRGDLGWSFQQRRPVAAVLADALPSTVLLAVAALAMQYTLALALAVWTAGRGLALRRAVAGLALLLYCLPTFWLGLLALHWLAHGWGLLPAYGSRSIATEIAGMQLLGDLLRHVLLPAAVLALAGLSTVYGLTEQALRETLATLHVLAARAKGVSELRLLWVHALRNAAGAATHRLGLDLPALASGALVVEVLFSRPGLGRVAHQAFLARDFPLLAAGATAAGGLIVAGSLLADLLHGVLDPRVRHG